MFTRQIGVRAVRALALVGATVGVAGCAAKVKRTEFNSEMARLREEIATSDHQLGSRIDSTNQATAQQMADHTRRLGALEQEFQAFRAEYKVSMEKMKTMLKFDVPVHFEFAKAEVRDSDHAVLERFATVVKEYYPGALITVEGFTDPAGSSAYNMQLGKRRADAVREYLVTTGGFDANHVKTVSYGESKNRQVMPGAAGPGDRGIANRRVALVVDHDSIATDGVALK